VNRTHKQRSTRHQLSTLLDTATLPHCHTAAAAAAAAATADGGDGTAAAAVAVMLTE